MNTNRLPHISASPEVVRHVLDQHGCTGFRLLETPCPCRSASALVCSECSEVVFLTVREGTWCEHAEEFWRFHGMGEAA